MPIWRCVVVAQIARRFPRLVGSSAGGACRRDGPAGLSFEHCGGCHAVRGTEAAGTLGPISAI